MLTNADGSIYEGEFKFGKKYGKGKLTNINGSVYEGEFYKGKKHGEGKLMNADGTISHEGNWLHDKPYHR